MIKWTTPAITLCVDGVDITLNEIFVTLAQGDRIKLTKSGKDLTVTTETHDEVTDTVIEFTLSQEESGAFNFKASGNVQVNWISTTGNRGATEIKTIPVLENLLDEVISYG